MRHVAVWVFELVKFLVGRRLHPLMTQCPICRQMVRLHANKAGRRHVLAHARTLYEGSRFSVHHDAIIKCAGSGGLTLVLRYVLFLIAPASTKATFCCSDSPNSLYLGGFLRKAV